MIEALDTPASHALAISIGVLPAFGVTMFALGRVGQYRPRIADFVRLQAAWLYTGFLLCGVAVAIGVGLLDVAALGAPASVLRVAAAVALTPVAVLVPYFVELALDGRGRPGPASAVDSSRPKAHSMVYQLRPGEWWALALLTALLEELLFRGMLLSALAGSGLGTGMAVLISGLVFGAHHVAFGVPAIVGKLVAGLAWGALMVLAGTIVVPLAAHVLFQTFVWRRMVRTQKAVVA